jgi:hypothetical protein
MNKTKTLIHNAKTQSELPSRTLEKKRRGLQKSLKKRKLKQHSEHGTQEKT